jgi:hypothetical protein
MCLIHDNRDAMKTYANYLAYGNSEYWLSKGETKAEHDADEAEIEARVERVLRKDDLQKGCFQCHRDYVYIFADRECVKKSEIAYRTKVENNQNSDTVITEASRIESIRLCRILRSRNYHANDGKCLVCEWWADRAMHLNGKNGQWHGMCKENSELYHLTQRRNDFNLFVPSEKQLDRLELNDDMHDITKDQWKYPKDVFERLDEMLEYYKDEQSVPQPGEEAVTETWRQEADHHDALIRAGKAKRSLRLGVLERRKSDKWRIRRKPHAQRRLSQNGAEVTPMNVLMYRVAKADATCTAGSTGFSRINGKTVTVDERLKINYSHGKLANLYMKKATFGYGVCNNAHIFDRWPGAKPNSLMLQYWKKGGKYHELADGNPQESTEASTAMAGLTDSDKFALGSYVTRHNTLEMVVAVANTEDSIPNIRIQTYAWMGWWRHIIFKRRVHQSVYNVGEKLAKNVKRSGRPMETTRVLEQGSWSEQNRQLTTPASSGIADTLSLKNYAETYNEAGDVNKTHSFNSADWNSMTSNNNWGQDATSGLKDISNTNCVNGGITNVCGSRMAMGQVTPGFGTEVDGSKPIGAEASKMNEPTGNRVGRDETGKCNKDEFLGTLILRGQDFGYSTNEANDLQLQTVFNPDSDSPVSGDASRMGVGLKSDTCIYLKDQAQVQDLKCARYNFWSVTQVTEAGVVKQLKPTDTPIHPAYRGEDDCGWPEWDFLQKFPPKYCLKSYCVNSKCVKRAWARGINSGLNNFDELDKEWKVRAFLMNTLGRYGELGTGVTGCTKYGWTAANVCKNVHAKGTDICTEAREGLLDTCRSDHRSCIAPCKNKTPVSKEIKCLNACEAHDTTCRIKITDETFTPCLRRAKKEFQECSIKAYECLNAMNARFSGNRIPRDCLANPDPKCGDKANNAVLRKWDRHWGPNAFLKPRCEKFQFVNTTDRCGWNHNAKGIKKYCDKDHPYCSDHAECIDDATLRATKVVPAIADKKADPSRHMFDYFRVPVECVRFDRSG